MFVILFLLLALNSSSSKPIQIPNDSSDTVPIILLGRELPECMNITRFRTLQDIIRSCVVTIFACAWVAIHPNLPGPYDCMWTKVKRKVTIMIYALLVPELMTMWAMRQYLIAREVTKELNKISYSDKYTINAPSPSLWVSCKSQLKEWFRDGVHQRDTEGWKYWTITHGFFLQMGGFMLCNGKTPLRVLEFEGLKELIADNKVDLSTLWVSEDEINDKSKGDLLSKLFVVFQTTWFIVHCIARWAAHLPVTELEVVTLAFAALNIITYSLWLKKPQGVLMAVSVPLKGGADTEPLPMIDEMRPSFMSMPNVHDSRLVLWLVFLPILLFLQLLYPIGKLMGFLGEGLREGSLRVPMFYVNGHSRNMTDLGDGDDDVVPSLIIATLFGALHLIPWSFDFPTAIEHLLWRASAVILTIQPFLLYVLGRAERGENTLGSIVAMSGIPGMVGIPLYIAARFLIFSLAISTLRDLPAKAYESVDWSTYLPHVS